MAEEQKKKEQEILLAKREAAKKELLASVIKDHLMIKLQVQKNPVAAPRTFEQELAGLDSLAQVADQQSMDTTQ